jgi:hypothetical protein
MPYRPRADTGAVAETFCRSGSPGGGDCEWTSGEKREACLQRFIRALLVERTCDFSLMLPDAT